MKPERILIIQTASLGDVILSTSLAEGLHNSFPDSSIDYLIKDGYQSLFKNHPFVNKVYVWRKTSGKYRNLSGLVIRIRRNSYDAVINVHRFVSSGIITALSGANVRSGFSKNPLSVCFTDKAKHSIGDGRHEIERNFSLLKPILDDLNDLKISKPRLYPSIDDYLKTNEWRTDYYITISPASLYFTKRLPEDKWIGLIDQLPVSINTILLGSAADSKLCEEIKERSRNKNVVNLAGKLTFLESGALMSTAKMNYVNDSAPLHIASSLNAPVVAVFCSTVTSFGFGPLSDNSTIVETTEKLSCRPCGLHGYQKCPLGHFKCAQTILIDQLLLPLKYELGNTK